MSTARIVGMIVLICGILVLAYGGFTYTKETHDADLGPLQIEVKNQERVNIPLWVGIVATGAGGALLLFGRPGNVSGRP